jgi:hypothetical protein
MRCSGVSIQLSLLGLVGTFDGRLVTAITVRDEAGDTPDCGDTDASQVMDLSVGKFLLQVLHNLPFGGGAEIFEKIAALLDRFETVYCGEKCRFGDGLLTPRFISVGFHIRTNVLMH